VWGRTVAGCYGSRAVLDRNGDVVGPVAPEPERAQVHVTVCTQRAACRWEAVHGPVDNLPIRWG